MSNVVPFLSLLPSRRWFETAGIGFRTACEPVDGAAENRMMEWLTAKNSTKPVEWNFGVL